MPGQQRQHSLPESLKAYKDGWRLIANESVPHKVMTEKEFINQRYSSSLRSSFTNLATAMTRDLNLKSVIHDFITFTNQKLKVDS